MSAPTLLVGLGGTGSKIVARVADLVKGKESSNIAFAVFDTDINELNEIQKKNPFIKTIQTSTKQTVGEYLNKDTHARDSWFPVNAILNGKTLTEGAGQVRSISRLALDTVIRAGKMEPLHEAIQSLYKVEEDKVEQALRVVIISSLAGGTGSGLILPVAMYIKNYLATHFRQSANITRGFFILPEVFYEVILGQTERNNLKANAYATLRELDAFLMKGDATLPERYQGSVKMEFPRAASDGYEEYSIRPYDFCFLFDAQNADGGKLNSFSQYLDHAANCIYAQSIGPMNKRSNSSEDNTIRKLAKERGRNRYAGAGASILLYPFEDVKKYIALQWAKESVSKQWLVFDKEYYSLCEENKKREEEGVATPNPDANSHYVKTVREKAQKKDPFSRAIVNACTTFKPDGVTKKSDRWVDYVGRLKEKVQADINAGQSDLDSTLEDINNSFGDLKSEWQDYVNLYFQIDTYKLQVMKYVEETARISAYSLFKASREFRTTKPQDFELEYYLTDGKNDFIHPNAVRYFLNEAYELMKKEKQTVDSQLKDLNDEFNNVERSIFDDESTDDVQETAQQAADRKVSIINKVSHKPTSDQEEAKNKLFAFLESIDEYKYKYMLSEVVAEGCEYIKSLLKAFELFYATFESKVSAIDKEIADISKKYVNKTGSTMRYVCADEKCLEGIYSKKRYTGSAISIDSKLAKDIYYSVLKYSLMADKPSNNRYFSDLFDEGILGYYETYVMQKYGSDINVDILTALEMEAGFVHPEYNEEENANELIDQYVKKVIVNTRALSCPFIESPLGESRDPINACTFNKSLFTEAEKNNPKKADFIRSELMNFGGAPDNEIPQNEIMFYQSFYGLRANDLSKFAPPEKTMTYDRSSGEYFKAYYELIAGIHPETHLSKEISPHIDRWWHIITKMPDLDEANQLKQEQEINAAFFWGVLCKYIDRFEDSNGHYIYKLDKEELDMDNNLLIVSNGTKCDKLYEVLDAIAIYPELVNKIINRVKLKANDDLNKNRALESGILMRGINKFAVAEPGICDGKNVKPATSIFTIPLMMKKSSTPDVYYEENVLQILKAEIEEIKKYLSLFYTEKELGGVMNKILTEQFDKYLADIAYESKCDKAIYKSSLFSSTISIIAKAFEALDLEDEARNIKDAADALKND